MLQCDTVSWCYLGTSGVAFARGRALNDIVFGGPALKLVFIVDDNRFVHCSCHTSGLESESEALSATLGSDLGSLPPWAWVFSTWAGKTIVIPGVPVAQKST